jgi:hypothetical protein
MILKEVKGRRKDKTQLESKSSTILGRGQSGTATNPRGDLIRKGS